MNALIQTGHALVPSTISEAMQLAEMMAGAKLVPKDLQKSPADCLMVIQQAVRWQMDPFAVAQECSVIQGKLMHSGKLVAAVVNARGNLSERLSFDYAGDGQNRTITVKGRLHGETEARTVTVRLGDAKTNNRVWQSQPDQQLMYHGCRVWARRHTPELMLGVWSPEEFDEPQNGHREMKDITPPAPQIDMPAQPSKRASGAGVSSHSAKRRDASGKNLWDHFQDDLRHCTTAHEVAKVEAYWLGEAAAGRFPEGWAGDIQDVCSKWLADLGNTDLAGALHDSLEQEQRPAADPIEEAMNSLPDNPVISANARARSYAERAKRQRPPGKRLTGADAIAVFRSLNSIMQAAKTKDSLEAWANEAPTQNAITSLPDDMYQEFRDDYASRLHELPMTILDAG
jgi:hypothetical protein